MISDNKGTRVDWTPKKSKPTWRMRVSGLAALGKRVNLTTDGCSNAPDFNFKCCCEEHDYFYRNCTSITKVNRKAADKKLRECIQSKWRLPILPWVYWVIVRLFGWIPWNKNQKEIETWKPPMNTPLPKHMSKKYQNIVASKRYIEESDLENYS